MHSRLSKGDRIWRRRGSCSLSTGSLHRRPPLPSRLSRHGVGLRRLFQCEAMASVPDTRNSVDPLIHPRRMAYLGDRPMTGFYRPLTSGMRTVGTRKHRRRPGMANATGQHRPMSVVARAASIPPSLFFWTRLRQNNARRTIHRRVIRAQRVATFLPMRANLNSGPHQYHASLLRSRDPRHLPVTERVVPPPSEGVAECLHFKASPSLNCSENIA